MPRESQGYEMNMNRLKALLAIGTMLGASSAFSADATLTFTGNILLPTCSVDTTGTASNVPLATAKTTDFAAVGDTQNPVAFNVKLTNCAVNTNVKMTVSGTIDTVPSVLKSTGQAAQVGVQLLKATTSGDTTGTPLSLNTAMAMGVVDASGTMTIPMVARYYRLGTMTGGTVLSTATVDFAYN
jgi:major type 1 subunit fimbrin (pilin)